MAKECVVEVGWYRYRGDEITCFWLVYVHGRLCGELYQNVMNQKCMFLHDYTDYVGLKGLSFLIYRVSLLLERGCGESVRNDAAVGVYRYGGGGA